MPGANLDVKPERVIKHATDTCRTVLVTGPEGRGDDTVHQ